MKFENLIYKYNTFIFDFDGVLADTNEIKKINVFKAVSDYLTPLEAKEFVDDFVSKNGIPREVKFKKKFKNNYKYMSILKKYEALNTSSFHNTKLIDGVYSFIKRLNKLNKKLVILSGGNKSEIEYILSSHGLDNYFDGVFSGPADKKANISKAFKNITDKMVFFGDSNQDYKLSTKLGLDFVFVSSKTQCLGWENSIGTDKSIEVIKDFLEISY